MLGAVAIFDVINLNVSNCYCKTLGSYTKYYKCESLVTIILIVGHLPIYNNLWIISSTHQICAMIFFACVWERTHRNNECKKTQEIDLLSCNCGVYNISHGVNIEWLGNH